MRTVKIPKDKIQAAVDLLRKALNERGRAPLVLESVASTAPSGAADDLFDNVLDLHSTRGSAQSLKRRATANQRRQTAQQHFEAALALEESDVAGARAGYFASGFHDFVIRAGGLTVFPRLVAADHLDTFARTLIPSGVESMDALLGGGVERGTSTLLVGPPGCGKSSIAFQYGAAATLRGDHVAAFMFDETKAAMLSRSSGLGIDVREGSGPGSMSLRQIDPVEISPGEFAALVRHSVEASDAKVVIIDSLNGYLNAMPHSSVLSAQLHELLSYLNNKGVATFLVVAQTGLMGNNTVSPVDASYLADTVIMCRYFEHQGRVKKALSVVKKRTGAHEESIRQLWFDHHGIHLSEPLLNFRGVLTGVPIEVEPTPRPTSAQPTPHGA